MLISDDQKSDRLLLLNANVSANEKSLSVEASQLWKCCLVETLTRTGTGCSQVFKNIICASY